MTAKKLTVRPLALSTDSRQLQAVFNTAVKTESAADFLKISAEWVRRLNREGWIKKTGKDRYRLIDATQGYLDYLRDDSRKTSKSAAASQVQVARAREIELRVAREEGRLVSMEDVDAVVSDILGTFRSELDGIPAAASRDLEVRRAVEKNLNEAIDRCRERFERAQRELAGGRDVTLEGDDD
jgi:phage terminase Nu1 subunit (DNA packaging protein)